ncbi:hypothetical protein FEP97_06804 [Burkholderia pseudomultivorans]|nr:hypothetical protein [Burkholderia pseudomultivorans]
MDAMGGLGHDSGAFSVVYASIGIALLIAAAFGVVLLDPARSKRRLAAFAHDAAMREQARVAA